MYFQPISLVGFITVLLVFALGCDNSTPTAQESPNSKPQPDSPSLPGLPDLPAPPGPPGPPDQPFGHEYGLTVKSLPGKTKLTVTTTDGGTFEIFNDGDNANETEAVLKQEDGSVKRRTAERRFKLTAILNPNPKESEVPPFTIDIDEILKLPTIDPGLRKYEIHSNPSITLYLKDPKGSSSKVEATPLSPLSDDYTPIGLGLSFASKSELESKQAELRESPSPIKSQASYANFRNREEFLQFAKSCEPMPPKDRVFEKDFIRESDFEAAVRASQLQIVDNSLVQKVRVAVQNTIVADKIVLTESRPRYPGEILDLDSLATKRATNTKIVDVRGADGQWKSMFSPTRIAVIGAEQNVLGSGELGNPQPVESSYLTDFLKIVQKAKEQKDIPLGVNHTVDAFTFLSESQFATRLGGSISAGDFSIGASRQESGSNARTTIAILYRQLFFTFKAEGILALESRLNPQFTDTDFQQISSSWNPQGNPSQVCVVDSVDYGAISVLVVEANATAEQILSGIVAAYNSSDAEASIGGNSANAQWLNNATLRLFTWGLSPTIFSGADYLDVTQGSTAPDSIPGEQNKDASLVKSYNFKQGSQPRSLPAILSQCFTVRPQSEMAWQYSEPIGYSCKSLLGNNSVYLASVGPASYSVSIEKRFDVEVDMLVDIDDDGDEQLLFANPAGEWHFAIQFETGVEPSTIGPREIDGQWNDQEVGPFRASIAPGKLGPWRVFLGERDSDAEKPPTLSDLANSFNGTFDGTWQQNVTFCKDIPIDFKDVLTNGTPLDRDKNQSAALTEYVTLARDPSVRLAVELQAIDHQLATLGNSTALGPDIQIQLGLLRSRKKEIELQVSLANGKVGLERLETLRRENPGTKLEACFYERVIDVLNNGPTRAKLRVRLVVPSSTVSPEDLRPKSEILQAKELKDTDAKP